MLEVSLVGLVVGFLLGLTSLGGGSLLTPVLIIVLRVSPVVAVGSDLLCQAITRMPGVALHAKRRAVDGRVLRLLATGSIPGALVAGAVVTLLHVRLGSDRFVLGALGIALLLTSATIALDPLLGRLRARRPATPDGSMSRSRQLLTVGGGFFVGFSVGLTSVGAGSLLMALLIVIAPHLHARKLVGTDLAHGAILLPVSALIAVLSGHVDLGLVAQLLVGSIPGVLLGGWAATALPERPLRLTVAGMLLPTGIRLLAGI